MSRPADRPSPFAPETQTKTAPRHKLRKIDYVRALRRSTTDSRPWGALKWQRLLYHCMKPFGQDNQLVRLSASRKYGCPDAKRAAWKYPLGFKTPKPWILRTSSW